MGNASETKQPAGSEKTSGSHDKPPAKEPWEAELDKVLNPTARSPGESWGTGGHPPSPTQVDKIVGSAWTLATPPTIDLHGVVGTRSTHVVRSIFAQNVASGSPGPRVQLEVSGIPTVQVARSPQRIPTSPSDDIQLDFRPNKEGLAPGTLDLEVSDPVVVPLAARREIVKVPIVGAAYNERLPEELQRPEGASPELAELPPSVDLGEQIVGSEHWFTIGSTKLIRPSPVSGKVFSSIKTPASVPNIPGELRMDMGTNAFTVDGTAQSIGTSQEAPLRVHFKPKRTGRFRGDLAVAIHWPDGRIDHQQIALTAGARALEDAPEQPAPAPTAARGALDPTIGGQEPSWNDVSTYNNVVGLAASKAATLAGKQRIGVDAAKGEIGGFAKQPEKRSMFAQLADLAILMGVSGVAQVFGKILAKNLGGMLLREADPDALKASKLVDGLGSAFKDGMKDAAKGSIATNSTAGHQTAEEGSEDPTINFFVRQWSILETLAEKNRELVLAEQKRLAPALGARPQAVFEVFKILNASFEKSANAAIGEQARATVASWVSGLAQVARGTNTATREGTHVGDTSNLENPHGSADAPGLLELHVRLDGAHVDPEKLHVERAELDGVASAAASRLKKVELASLGIPVRVIVKSSAGTAFITRDEAGRVHVQGELPHQDPSSAANDEQWNPTRSGDRTVYSRNKDLQLNRDATAICDRLLSKSLEDWNVGIITNDVKKKEPGQ